MFGWRYPYWGGITYILVALPIFGWRYRYLEWHHPRLGNVTRIWMALPIFWWRYPYLGGSTNIVIFCVHYLYNVTIKSYLTLASQKTQVPVKSNWVNQKLALIKGKFLWDHNLFPSKRINHFPSLQLFNSDCLEILSDFWR